MKIVKNSCNFCQVNYVNKNKTNSKIIIKKVQFVSLIFCKKKKKKSGLQRSWRARQATTKNEEEGGALLSIILYLF